MSIPVSSVMPFAPVLAFSPASPAASACRHPRYEEPAQRALVPLISGLPMPPAPGDIPFSIISTGGSSHTVAEGRGPHFGATKKVTVRVFCGPGWVAARLDARDPA
jgi:hypothetical protein